MMLPLHGLMYAKSADARMNVHANENDTSSVKPSHLQFVHN